MAWNQRFAPAFALALVAAAATLALAWLLTAKPFLGAMALLGWHLSLVLPMALLAQALQVQNQPTLARLVPRQVARLRRQQVGLWAVSLALHALPYLALGPGPAVTALAVAALAVPLVLTMVGAGLRVWLPSLLLSLAAAVGLGVLVQDMGRMPVLVVATVLLLALPPWLLSRLIRSGGAQHRAHYAQRRAVYGIGMLFSLDPVKQQAALPAWWQRWIGWWFRRHWQRLVQQPSPRNVLPRVALAALGPAHWTQQLGALSLVMLLFGTVIGMGAWVGMREGQLQAWVHANHFTLLVFLVALPLGSFIHPLSRQRRARCEQALLVLLPGVPQGANLTRRWCLLRTRHYLHAWCGCAAIATLVMAPGGEPSLGWLALSLAVGLLASLSFALDLSVRYQWLSVGLPTTALAGLALQWPATQWLLAGGIVAVTALGWAYAARALGEALCRCPPQRLTPSYSGNSVK